MCRVRDRGDVVTVERVTLSDGRQVDREVRPDGRRDVSVARVVSLSPPAVDVPGVGVMRVSAITQGLTVVVGDWVFAARVGTPLGERVVVLVKLTRLGD